jgi:hypothetical protein
MATISFFRTGASSEEQQIGFSSDPTLPDVNNTIGIEFPITFVGGDFSSSSLLTAARTMIGGQRAATPLAGGALTINGESVGSYDYKVSGTTTISSFSASEWFSSTQDTRSSWIVVNGNLTINSGQTVIPSVRKLFTVIYVTGNLVVNGSISMRGRGANHSGTGDSGGATTAATIRIGTGSFSAVVNPQVPATGGAGGAVRATDGANNGTAGTVGGSGGGGSGYAFSSGTAGSGAAGTSFSGGSGGGGAYGGTGGNAVSNGGAGGNGSQQTGTIVTGGAGNPGGTLKSGAGGDGTGGTLIVIVEGSLSGTGTISVNGIDSTRFSGTVPGGASGAGSLTVLFGTNPSSAVTVTATGGSGNSGGNGGNGTARKLAIGSN